MLFPSVFFQDMRAVGPTTTTTIVSTNSRVSNYSVQLSTSPTAVRPTASFSTASPTAVTTSVFKNSFCLYHSLARPWRPLLRVVVTTVTLIKCCETNHEDQLPAAGQAPAGAAGGARLSGLHHPRDHHPS